MSMYHTRAFEGRDISPSEEAIEALRREQWRATRAPFSREAKGLPSKSIGTTATLVGTVEGSTTDDLVRLKRVQWKILVPKQTSEHTLWAGFVRIPDGTGILANSLDFSSPTLLRPIVVTPNSDHATYWDAYLPAVNLANNGGLALYAKVIEGNALTIYGSMRWVQERGIEG